MPAAVAEREGASTERSNGGLPAPAARYWAMSFATIMLKAGRVAFTALAAAGLVLAMTMLKAGRVAFTVLAAAGLVLAIVFVVGVSLALALGDDHEGLILVATSATYCGCLVAWFVMWRRRRLAEGNRGWPRVRTPGPNERDRPVPAAMAEQEGALTERIDLDARAAARRWAMSFATIMLKAGRAAFTVLAAAGLTVAIVLVVGVSAGLALGDEALLVATLTTYCGCLVAWFVMWRRRRLAEGDRGWPMVRAAGRSMVWLVALFIALLHPAVWFELFIGLAWLLTLWIFLEFWWVVLG